MSIGSHNDEVVASLRVIVDLRRQFIPCFLARRLARKYEKMSPQASSSPPIRRQIITVRSPFKKSKKYGLLL